MAEEYTIKDIDYNTQRIKEIENRQKEYDRLRKRLEESRVGASTEARLALEICEFLLDNVEYRKIV